ncbi:SDR family oxidoreductase [Pseudarthrobacter psychrotolerans]|uniref:SDR family oxidoreductase n=1 Tax=Pseudarthrobacter psychrotolerans TaxID=2697569 RepID=A0A6P1NND0_9MICC|nr:SDR family oxidoreductase [Pseudarthrobacter psychrotolerans]
MKQENTLSLTSPTLPTRALVTGAGHGIGRACALALAKSGADIVVHYNTSKDDAQDTVAEIHALGRNAVAVRADLTVQQDVDDLLRAARDELGGLDTVVANAGHLVDRRALADIDVEFWHKVIDVNLSSAFFTVQAAAPLLAESGGSVILMSSVAAHNGGGPGAIAYAAAKAGVDGLARALAKELAPAGVRVNAVAPGFIANTAFHDTFTGAEAQRKISSGIPLGRSGTAEDVANVVTFLSSPEASFITGETWDVTGGEKIK